MLQNYSRYRILQEFFDFPRKDFQMREISRRIRLAQVSVMSHLKALLKEGLITKVETGIYPAYKANMDSADYKLLKRQNLAWRIQKSGLVSYLEERLRPNCIILFGSCSKGEDTEKSDVDLFVQSKEESLELEKFERVLKRKISLFFEPRTTGVSKELLNNVINGEVLYGYLKVF